MDIKQAASAYGSIANITQNNVAALPPEKNVSTVSFSDLVNDALTNSVDSGKKAEEISRLALMGKADITELATAVSNAELALNMVVAVRDKVISAYQQIMQMPV